MLRENKKQSVVQASPGKATAHCFYSAAFGRGLKLLSYDQVVPGGHLTVLDLVKTNSSPPAFRS